MNDIVYGATFNIIFRIGDTVSWASHGNLHTKRKSGVIVAVVPAGEQIEPISRVLTQDGVKHTLMTRITATARRDDSYLVLVDNGVRQAKLYWPSVSLLKKMTSEAPSQSSRGGQ